MRIGAKIKVAAKVVVVLAIVGGVLFGAMKVRDKLMGDKKPRSKWGAMARGRVAAVRLATATLGAFVRKETYPGDLASPQTVDIAMKVGGRLTQVNGQLGEPIERGTLVAEVENADIRSQLREAEATTAVQKASLARAEVDLTQWERELERKAPLFKKELLPVQERETLEARRDQAKAQIDLASAQVTQAQARGSVLRVQLDATRVYAPWSGRVSRRLLYPGAVVTPGSPILTLVDTDALIARFRVPEREAGDVKQGTAVDVIVDALGGEKLFGRVVRLAPTIDVASRTLLVEAEVTSGSRPITAGMFVRAQVTLESRDSVTLVSRAALGPTISEKGETVLMRAGVGWKGMRPRMVAREVRVTVGKSMVDEVEVVEGLEAGESVIVEGHANLRHRDPVRIVGAGAGAEKIGVTTETPRKDEEGGEEKGGRKEDAGAEAGAGAEAVAETEAGAGAEAETDAGAEAEADAGAGAGKGSGSGSGAGAGADADAGGDAGIDKPSGTFIRRGFWGTRRGDARESDL